MKKAKSIIGKKSELKQAQLMFAEFGVRYIKSWTNQELKRYITEPVVIPVGKYGFFIGPYIIDGIHPDCWKVVSQLDDRCVHYFISKPAAILYCLCNVAQKYTQAMELLEIDTKLGRLDTDLQNYSYSLQKAQTKGDNIKSTILLNRYIDAKMQRRTYANILKKTLNSAKYLNFGKQPL